MTRDDYLRARGWARHPLTGEWRPPHPEREEWLDRENAIRAQEMRDSMSVEAHGSVRFYPTAEHAATSPLLAACAAWGMCERDVIDRLARENARLVVEVQSVVEMLRPSTVVLLSIDESVKRAQAIGAAWKALAKAEANPDGIERSGGRRAAKAALRALGVDPDAEEEAGR